MQVRRNTSGGYKVRLPFVARDGYQRQTVELGLQTRDRTQAYRVTYVLIRILQMLGMSTDMRWHLDKDTPLSPQQIADQFMNVNVVHEREDVRNIANK
ncbi:MAG: hypothetical protein Q4C88_06815 [Akkermansia sp.]|nr:hypothetical protein [Akkermansia sp.]